MIENDKSWLLKQEFSNGYGKLREFSTVYSELGLKEGLFHGDVLVGGTGTIFPERSFLCKSPDYNSYRSEINTVTCCDYEHFFPEYILEDGFERQFISPIDQAGIKRLDAKTIFVPESMWTVMDKMDGLYDVILFLRIPNLPNQLRSNGLSILKSKLKPGGIALVSGSKIYDQWDLENIAKNYVGNTKVQRLVDTNDLCNCAVGGHYSLILQNDY